MPDGITTEFDETKRIPIMHMTVSNEVEGEFKVPLMGRRFNNNDLYEGSQLEEFKKYNGWIILESLIDMILFYRPYPVIEIGCGKSTEILLPAAVKADVDFHAVDTNPVKHENFAKAAKKAGPGHYKFYNMTSDHFMESIFDDVCGFVLIDANHDYEQAKKEFYFFFEHLIHGGVIFLHDTLPPDEFFLRPTACHDVYRLRQELEKQTDKMDCFSWPYSAGFMGLTMVIKKDPGREYWEE